MPFLIGLYSTDIHNSLVRYEFFEIGMLGPYCVCLCVISVTTFQGKTVFQVVNV